MAGSRIGREIKQRRPFRSREQECLVALLRTTDTLRRVLATAVEPYGVTLQQYNVLRILRGAGAGGLPTLEIAERMLERTPGITRLLDRLGRKGLVRRQRCRQDRRQVLCSITDAGLGLLRQMDAPVEEADRACLAALAPLELVRLTRLLDQVRTGHDEPAA